VIITSTVARSDESGVAPNSVTFAEMSPGMARSRRRMPVSMSSMPRSRWKRSTRFTVKRPCWRSRDAPNERTPGSAPTTIEVDSSHFAGTSSVAARSTRAARRTIACVSVSGSASNVTVRMPVSINGMSSRPSNVICRAETMNRTANTASTSSRWPSPQSTSAT